MTTGLTSGDGGGGVAAGAPRFYSMPEAAGMIGMGAGHTVPGYSRW
jgi:hypothetical protein